MTKDVDHEAYADLYGPSESDYVRLTDTELFAEVEVDLRTHGDKAISGGGETLRDGPGMALDVTQAGGALDWVVTNTTVIDPVLGVVAGDIDIRDGDIVDVGKAGSPNTMDGVDMVVDPATDAYPAEEKIATTGALDIHVHWNSAQLHEHGLVSGITTILGGGCDGGAATCTTDSQNIKWFLQAAETWSISVGFYGKGNAPTPEPLIRRVEAGVYAFKLHED